MIELKNIKHAEHLSQETHAYSASLYFDGKRIGVVSNDGHGGCDMFRGDQDAYRRANDWCKANLPKWSLSGSTGGDQETDIEMHCCDLVNDYLVARDLRRKLKSKVLMLDCGAVFETSFRGVKVVTQAHIDHVKAKHPSARILNELPLSEALEIIKKSTR